MPNTQSKNQNEKIENEKEKENEKQGGERNKPENEGNTKRGFGSAHANDNAPGRRAEQGDEVDVEEEEEGSEPSLTTRPKTGEKGERPSA